MKTIAKYTDVGRAAKAYREINRNVQVPLFRVATGTWVDERGELIFLTRGVEILAFYRRTVAAVVDYDTVIMKPHTGAEILICV